VALVTSPLLVLDTPALYYRSFHGLPDTIRSPHGRPVHAVRGLLDTIAQLVQQWDSRRIIAVMDADWRPDFRTAILPEYKAHRITDEARGTETPPELEEQLPVIFDALSAVGIPIAEVPGTEADDVIASIVAQATETEVVVVSSDRDLLALLEPGRRVRVHRPRTGGRWETTAPQDLPGLYGVADGTAYRALAALRGDPSDGIPGAPRIGEKTAAKLVAGFGGLEEIIAAAQAGSKEHGLSDLRRTSILEHADAVRAGARVMEGLTDLDVREFVEEAGGTPDRARAVALGTDWGLERSVARLLEALGAPVEASSAAATTASPAAPASAPVAAPTADAGADVAGWARNLCAFDLETTGVDPATGRIVSAALVPFADGREGPALTWLVDPGIEIPEESQRVHGITTARVRAEGTPTALALPQILAAITALRERGTVLAGHNIVYDLTVLAAEAVRGGLLAAPQDLLVGLPPVVDTLVIDRQIDRFRKGPRTLTAVAEHYGAPLADAHDALADARAAGLIALAQSRTSSALAELRADDLHASQIDWKREQAASLQEFLRRRRPSATVNGDWPLEPLD
jgi:5'-3' exonuclease/DNA polymerase III epsilon subunit-like protein